MVATSGLGMRTIRGSEKWITDCAHFTGPGPFAGAKCAEWPSFHGIKQRGHKVSKRLEMRMNRGFYTIMAAQFFSSLADNALLIAAIALLVTMDAPTWMTPLLKLFFVLSYVLLAPFVGAFADSLPKGRVMFITNMIK